MKYIIINIIVVSYCLMTIIVNTPNNPIRIKLEYIVAKYDNYFYQKWSFFAPPPTYNLGLYFCYYNDSTKVESFEILSEVSQKKVADLPFNSKAEFIDYALNSSISNLIQRQASYREITNYEFKDSTIEFILKKTQELFNDKIFHEPNINTLINYSKIFKKKNCNTKLINGVKITITMLPIPKFIDRYIKKSKEEILFNTQIFKI